MAEKTYLCYHIGQASEGAIQMFAEDKKTLESLPEREKHEYNIRKVPEGFVIKLVK